MHGLCVSSVAHCTRQVPTLINPSSARSVRIGEFALQRPSESTESRYKLVQVTTRTAHTLLGRGLKVKP